jgi:hypothetical protein
LARVGNHVLHISKLEPDHVVRFFASMEVTHGKTSQNVFPSGTVRAIIARMSPRLRPLAVAAALGLTALAATPVADAFCGFYVSGADAKLFNNATIVVLMREGTRTVLSMQNNYQGPAEDFAMVVPVPVVLNSSGVFARQKEDQERQ